MTKTRTTTRLKIFCSLNLIRFPPAVHTKSPSNGRFPAVTTASTSMPKRVLTLPPTAHDFERFLHADERREGVALVFDDVPLDARGRLADVGNPLPRQLVLGNQPHAFGLRGGLHL